MTFLINQAIFILINVLNAANDAAKIRKDKDVDHFLNGVAYVLSIIVFILIFEMDFVYSLLFMVGCFCNRQLTFDIPLNLMRKLKWDYVSPAPTSWVDKLEVKLFGQNGDTPNIIYCLTFIATLIIGSII